MAGVARYTAYPVVHDGEVLGVLPLAVRPRHSQEPVGRAAWCASACSRATTCWCVHADDDALEAFAALAEADLHRALVLDDGQLTGFISITDVARLLAAPRPSGPGISAPRE